MSEEININQDVKKKVKKEIVSEGYQYKPEVEEQLIMDKPSEPLIKNKKIDNPSEQLSEQLNKKETNMQKATVKSNKELYESYIKELKYFSLSINSEIIYDSSIDKSTDSPLKFDNDYFILYGKKYSYNGLKIQKINKR